MPAGSDGNQRLPLGFDCEILLTKREVARVLRVAEHCVANLHRAGKLAAVKVGRVLRWRPGDVRQYVKELGDDDRGGFGFAAGRRSRTEARSDDHDD
jgi:hypothetical protein